MERNQSSFDKPIDAGLGHSQQGGEFADIQKRLDAPKKHFGIGGHMIELSKSNGRTFEKTCGVF